MENEKSSFGIICYTDLNNVSGVSLIENAENFLDDPENFKTAIYDLIEAIGTVNKLEGVNEAQRSVEIEGDEFKSKWVHGIYIPLKDESVEHVVYISSGHKYVPLNSVDELIAILVGLLGLDAKQEEDARKVALKVFIEIMLSVLTEKPFFTLNTSPVENRSFVIGHIKNLKAITAKIAAGDISTMSMNDLEKANNSNDDDTVDKKLLN